MTGIVVKQTLTKDSFGKGNSTGYFITLNVKPEVVTEDIDIKYEINGHEYHAKYSDLTEDSLTLLLKLEKGTSNEVKITIDSDGPDKNAYTEKEYTVDLSKLQYAIDTEEVVRNFIDALNNENNKFYTATYNEDGTSSVVLDLTSFKTINDIKSTGITGGLYNALKTGDFSKITLTYAGDSGPVKAEFTPSMASDDNSYKENGTITTEFNKLILAMMGVSDISQAATAQPAKITNKSYVIKFELADDLVDVGKASYTTTFTVSNDSDYDIKNVVDNLVANQYYNASYELKDDTVNVIFDAKQLTTASKVVGSGIIYGINNLLISGKYTTITLTYGSTVKDFNIADYSTTLDGNDDVTKKFNAIIDAMINGGGLAGKEFTISLVSNTGVTNVNEGKVYHVLFNTIENTKDEDFTLAAETLNATATTYGFESIKYNKETNTAEFKVEDPEALAGTFATSGIVELFKTYSQNATQVKYGKSTYTLSGQDSDAQIIAWAGEVLKDLLGGNINADEITLGDLIGKTATAKITYKYGSVTEEIDYNLSFISDMETYLEIKDEKINGYVDEMTTEETLKDFFKDIKYTEENHEATFTIDSADKKFSEFEGFEQFVAIFSSLKQNATSIKYSINGTEGENDFALDDLQFVAEVGKVIEKATGEKVASNVTLGQFAGKVITIKVAYKLGEAEETVTYTLNFEYTQEELIADKDAEISNYVKNSTTEVEGIETYLDDIKYENKTATFNINKTANTKTLMDLYTDETGKKVKDSIKELIEVITKDATTITYTCDGVTKPENFDKEDIEASVGLVLEKMLSKDHATSGTFKDLINKTLKVQVVYKVGSVETEKVEYTITFTGTPTE